MHFLAFTFCVYPDTLLLIANIIFLKKTRSLLCTHKIGLCIINPLNAALNPIRYLLALLGAHHFLRVSRIRVKSLTLRLLMPYIYMTLVT